MGHTIVVDAKSYIELWENEARLKASLIRLSIAAIRRDSANVDLPQVITELDEARKSSDSLLRELTNVKR